jgi:hypothetical protein
MVAQPLQHIADIQGQPAFGRRHIHPAAVGAQYLQPRFLRTKQQRDQIDILMRARTDAAFGIALDRRIMEQPQYRIANVDLVVEPVGVHPQIDRYIGQYLRPTRSNSA